MYFQRDLEAKIQKYIQNKEIVAIFGPRQSGKTTLLKHIAASLENTVFLTFEDIEIQSLFEEDIKHFITVYVKPYRYIFIDEFQYAKSGGRNLKYIYDTVPDKKLFITGSSVVDLSVEAVKYLAGRIFIFNLYPFSFGEYLRATEQGVSDVFAEIPVDEELSPSLITTMRARAYEYSRYGGYPRVIVAGSEEEKREVLKNLVNVLVLRDIRDIAGITDEMIMYKLLKLLSFQIGNIIVYEELGSATGIKAPKLKEYLSILEKVFTIKQVFPFYTNPRTELVKNPKSFFFDTGLRNSIAGDFRPPDERQDGGALIENFVFAELAKKDFTLRYYRSKAQAEVDFILQDRCPLEIKSGLVKATVSRSLRAYIEKYSPDRCFVLNAGYCGGNTVTDRCFVLNAGYCGGNTVGSCALRFLPFFLASKIECEPLGSDNAE